MRIASFLVMMFLAACSQQSDPIDASVASDAGDIGEDVGTLLADTATDVAMADLGPPTDIGPDAGTPPLFDPNCSTAGCLRAARHVGDFPRDNLIPFLEPGVSIDNGYSIWVIEYVTPFRAEPATSSATVAIPLPLAAPAGGYGIVANAHGTVGVSDSCQLAGTIYGSGLAGLFGARGTISIAPDYVGLGTPHLHPYLVREAEGTSVLDALRAAQMLADRLEVATSGRMAVVGLSQGGHATLAAAGLHSTYAPELDIRAFAAAAPASAWLEQWAQGVVLDGPHLSYHALIMYAWNDYFGPEGSPIWSAPMAAQIDDIMTRRCSFDFGGTVGTFAEVLPLTASEIFDADFLAAYAGADLSAYPQIQAAFAANRIEPFPQTAPLAIWQGDADVTVPEVYTTQMVDALRAGGVEVDYRVVPGADHEEVAFGFVATAQQRTEESIDWVLARLAGP